MEEEKHGSGFDHATPKPEPNEAKHKLIQLQAASIFKILPENDLHKGSESDAGEKFLMEEIKVLEEVKRIGLPNFMPGNAFSYPLLQNKNTTTNFSHVHNGQNLIVKLKEKSIKHLIEVLEMEKLIDYTRNPEYMSEYNELMTNQDKFVKIVNTSNYVVLDGFEHAIKVGHLRRYSTLLLQAFDLKMKLRAYCKIVLRGLMHSTALHLQLSIFNLVDKDLGDEIVKDTMSPYAGGIEKLLEEAPSVSMKGDKLNRNIKLLREIKGVVARFNMQ
ncbi:hypothetical protein JHK82_037005 [Glycine max]|nr:hypothetical protein JHK85_037760 [Glycine max]KAG5113736.1 hypothetical protein JHK82_037005 [Glycine max]